MIKWKIPEKYLFLFPALIVIFAISLWPFLYAIYMSFTCYDVAKPEEQGKFLGLANYWNLLHDEHFIISLEKTFLIVLPAVVIEFVLGLAIAALLTSKEVAERARKYLTPFIIIPTMLAPVVVGLVWLFMLHPTFGILTQALHSLGLFIGKSLLGDPSTAPLVIILMDIWEWTPYMAVVFQAGILSLPQEIFEAAEVDGASSWRKFCNVTLPMLKPLILVILVLRTADAWRMFDAVWIMTGGGPGMATEVSSIFAYRVNFRWWRLGYGSSLVILLFLFIFIFSVITYLKLSKK